MWKNLDEYAAFKKLCTDKKVSVKCVLTPERIKKYTVPCACGFIFCAAAKSIDESIVAHFQELADEASVIQKYLALLSGEMVNTGEKRMVLHHLTRGQLAADV